MLRFLRSNPFVTKLSSYFLFIISVGALMALLDRQPWWAGWVAYTILLVVSLTMLLWVGHQLLLPEGIRKLVSIVFCLRLGLGVAMMLGLPVLGYQDNQASSNGYLYQDSYVRDTQAWHLASSNEPILSAFSPEWSGDQYGGLLALNAFTYRFLSPTAHRPYLTLIWIALAGAVSTAVLWRSIGLWLDNQNHLGLQSVQKISALAAGIFSFYPEAFFLGSSHMREAVVMLGIVLMFLGYAQMTKEQEHWYFNFVLGMGLLLFFQPPLALISLLVLFGLWVLEPGQRKKWKIIIWFAGLVAAAIFMLVGVWQNLPSLSNLGPLETIVQWFHLNFNFQSYLSERSSGMLQKLLSSVGEGWTLPIVLGYGTAQPVLPAVLIDPAAWIWRLLNTFRAAGWYILAPMVGYSMIAAFRSWSHPRSRQFFALSLFCITWIFITAAVAGGDQWDNPRYRTLFLPWMAILSAWVWNWSRRTTDPWLIRLWIAEAICVIVFLEWYISRYYPALIHLDIRFTIGLAVFAVCAFLFGSLGWDILRRKNQ